MTKSNLFEVFVLAKEIDYNVSEKRELLLDSFVINVTTPMKLLSITNNNLKTSLIESVTLIHWLFLATLMVR